MSILTSRAKLVVRMAFYGGQLALYEGVTRAEESAPDMPDTPDGPDASPPGESETKESPESKE